MCFGDKISKSQDFFSHAFEAGIDLSLDMVLSSLDLCWAAADEWAAFN